MYILIYVAFNCRFYIYGDILEQLKGETDQFGSVHQVVLGKGYSDVTIFVSEDY